MTKLTIFLLCVFSLMKMGASSELIPQTEETGLLKQSRASILLEMTGKVLQLKVNITRSGIKESSNIRDYKDMIKSEVRVSADSIREQLRNLDEQVKNATEEAIQQKTNIYSCIRAEKRARCSQARVSKLYQCKKSCSFDVLQLKLTELAAVKLNACTIIPTCTILHPLSNSKLKSCILNGIENSKLKSDSITEKLENEAAEVFQRANDCIQENLGNLDLAIEKISDDFSECVANKFNETISSL